MDYFIKTLVLIFLCAVTQAKDENYKLTNNKTFIVTTILSDNFLRYKQGDNLAGNDRFEGFIPDLLKAIADRLDMTYTLQLVKDGRYGMLSNEKWNGMIGEVIEERADMAAAPLTVTSVRERVVDFTKPFMSSGIGLVMSRRTVFGDSQAGGDVFILLKLLHHGVWFTLIVAALLVWLCCIFLRRFHPDERREGEDPSLLKSVLTESKGIFTKNSLPRSKARKVLITVNYLFWLVTLIIYVAALFWFVGSSRPKDALPKYSSAEDVIRGGGSFGTIQGGSTYSFFKNSRVPLYRTAFEKMSSSGLVSSTAQGLQRARSGDYGFFFDYSTAPLNRKPCDLVRVGPLLNSVGFAFALRIRSPLRNYMNLAILELRENGVLESLRQKWWDRKGECPKTPVVTGPRRKSAEKEVPPVGLDCFYLPIIALIAAIVVSLLMTLYSILTSKNTKKANESQQPLNDKTEAKSDANATVEINA